MTIKIINNILPHAVLQNNIIIVAIGHYFANVINSQFYVIDQLGVNQVVS